MRKRQVVLRRTSSEEPSRSSLTTASSLRVRYGECQKNHAAAVGGHAVDGCREFMASSSEEGTVLSLTCAACGCHRSFHRREMEAEVSCDCTSPPSTGN